MQLQPIQVLQRISTRGVLPANRLNFWNDLAEDTYGPLVIDASRRSDFEGEIARLPLRGCELTSARSSAAVVQYKRGSLGAAAHAQSINLVLQYRGTSRSDHDGKVWCLQPGDFAVFDPSRPYRLSFDQPSHVLVLRVLRTRVAERGLDLEPFVGIKTSGGAGAASLLSTFLRTAYEQCDAFEEDWVGPTSESLFALLDLVYGRKSERRVAAAPDRLFLRAKDCIEVRLYDPSFAAVEVASVLGVSPRYVQLLFARAGTTPSRYLLRRRLEVAAARLKMDERCSVSGVAFAVGFNDLSHFSRAFRRQYQKSAGEYRALQS
ncbi:MAG: helix-turn-helix domain-containing protein [Pseudomonadota bacterium]